MYPDWKVEASSPREFFIILIGLSVYFLIRLYFALDVPIHPDEAYYWAWSMQPDLAYYDQGPGVAYYILLFTSWMGDTYLALKTAALFSIFPVSLATYYTARELDLGRRRSLLAMLGMLIFPGAFGGIALIMHDTPLLICWSLALYCWVRYLRRREDSMLWLTFLFMGLGALCKHTMGGFALSLLAWFIWQPGMFYLLKKRNFWLAMLLTLVCLSPMLLWNMQNHWDQVGAILHLRSSGGVSGGGSMGQMILGQMLIISPLWFLAALLVFCMVIFHLSRKFSYIKWQPDLRGLSASEKIIAFLKRPLQNFNDWLESARWQEVVDRSNLNPEETRRMAFWFVFCNALVMPLFFLYISNTRLIQANWVIPSYPAIFVLMAAFLSRSKEHSLGHGVLRKVFLILLIAGILPVAFFNLYAFKGKEILESLGSKMPARNYLQYRTEGFAEIIAEADALRKEVDPEAGIAAGRYQDAAIASWYLPEHEFVPSMNISQKNQYSYWKGLEKGRNYFVIAIQEDPDRRLEFGFEMWFAYMFAEAKSYPIKTIERDGMAVKKYQIWYVKNYRVAWYEVLALYMDRLFILDIMSSMRGYSRNLDKSSVMAEMNRLTNLEGVCQTKKPEGIIELLSNVLQTGKTYRCVAPDLEKLEQGGEVHVGQ